MGEREDGPKTSIGDLLLNWRLRVEQKMSISL